MSVRFIIEFFAVVVRARCFFLQRALKRPHIGMLHTLYCIHVVIVGLVFLSIVMFCFVLFCFCAAPGGQDACW